MSLHLIGNHYLITQDKNCTLKVWRRENHTFECVVQKNFNNPSFCNIAVSEDFTTDSTTYIAIPQPQSSIDVYFLHSASLKVASNLQHKDPNLKLGDVCQMKIFRYDAIPYLAAVYEDGTLLIWNLLEANSMSCYKLTNDTPMSFDFDSATLQGVCGTAEKTLTFFKLDSHLQVTKCKNVDITNPGVGSLRIRPDKKIVVAGCWDGRLRIFSWKSCKLLAVLDCHRVVILDVNFSTSPVTILKTKYLLGAAANDKSVSLWKIYE